MEFEKCFVESDNSEEPEPDLDHSEYANILDSNFRKIVLAEEHFTKVKRILKDKRIEQIIQKRNEVMTSTSNEIKKRNTEAYEEFEHLNKLAEKYKVLESDSLLRQVQGMRAVVKTSQEDNIILAQERLIESITSQISHLDDVLISAQLMRKKLHEFRDLCADNEYVEEDSSTMSSEFDVSAPVSSLDSDVSKEASNSEDECESENEIVSGAESDAPDFPVVTYQLKDADVINDLELFELAIREADLRDSYRAHHENFNNVSPDVEMQHL